jgi:peptidyl-prolyl cis-trans isomerase SurA
LGSSPQPTAPNPNKPLLNIEDQTVRERVRVSIGGAQICIRLSNEYGSAPLLVGSANVASPTDPASVRPGSIHTVTFDGHNSVTIPAGAPVLSDPVAFPVAPGAEITVSLYFPKRVATPTLHALALKRAVVSQHGDHTRAEKIEAAATSRSSILLTAVLVSAQSSQRLVVAFGDSVTDGDGSTVEADRNWPSDLVRRLGKTPEGSVVAVVNDEAITQYDLDDAKRVVLQQLKQQNVQPPAQDILEKQVLERMMTERSLLQFAKENGVKIDDTQIERAILRIAQDNKLSAEDFRKALAKENIAYARYREDIRNELTVQRLREREVDSKITVSDAEVDQYLAMLKVQNTGGETEYKLAHILVMVPEQASSEQIDARKRRAEEALRALKSGADFGQVAAGFSDASDALTGGNLGWRSGARLPTVFGDEVRAMQVGQISGITRSPAGFHIVKLLEKRSRNDAAVVDQTHARHILVRVNEVVSESDAKAKADRLKERIGSGAKFEELAKLNSEDTTSAKGGDLAGSIPATLFRNSTRGL